MPTLKQNRKASGSRSNTSETHKFLTQVQQQQPPKDHNLKRKAADSEKVAEEDSENEVVESPEVKRAKMEYLKSLYGGNKQQSEAVLETEEKKEERHSEDKAESQKKKSDAFGAMQSNQK